jgi:hypothetical protein
LDVILEHLIVIGGGYVGLELSQAMRRFGPDLVGAGAKYPSSIATVGSRPNSISTFLVRLRGETDLTSRGNENDIGLSTRRVGEHVCTFRN